MFHCVYKAKNAERRVKNLCLHTLCIYTGECSSECSDTHCGVCEDGSVTERTTKKNGSNDIKKSKSLEDESRSGRPFVIEERCADIAAVFQCHEPPARNDFICSVFIKSWITGKVYFFSTTTHDLTLLP